MLATTQAAATRTEAGYLRWLNFISHEYCHAFNVKRLRPVELGPFDYEREPHTPSLWISEGFTSYVGNLAVLRAGLSDERDAFSRRRRRRSRQLQRSPGPPRADARAVVARRVDEREHLRRQHQREHVGQLLPQGTDRRLPPRREGAPRDERRQEPGRCDAAGVSAVRRRAGLQARRVPRDRRGGGGRRSGADGSRGPSRPPTSSTTRTRSTGTACSSRRAAGRSNRRRTPPRRSAITSTRCCSVTEARRRRSCRPNACGARPSPGHPSPWSPAAAWGP